MSSSDRGAFSSVAGGPSVFLPLLVRGFAVSPVVSAVSLVSVLVVVRSAAVRVATVVMVVRSVFQAVVISVAVAVAAAGSVWAVVSA